MTALITSADFAGFIQPDLLVRLTTAAPEDTTPDETVIDEVSRLAWDGRIWPALSQRYAEPTTVPTTGPLKELLLVITRWMLALRNGQAFVTSGDAGSHPWHREYTEAIRLLNAAQMGTADIAGLNELQFNPCDPAVRVYYEVEPSVFNPDPYTYKGCF